MKTKVAFGVGSGAEAIAGAAIGSYTLLYYNQILQVPAHWVSFAIAASLLLDAVTEPIIGSLSDRTRSRLGRRHPWMFAAPIPIALMLWSIYNPPAILDHLGLTIWAGVTVSLLRQVMAIYHTPHLALGGELSPNYTERSKVMAYNSLFTWVGAAGTSWVALTFFFPATPEYPRGLLNPEPWPRFATAMALSALAILLASAWFTRDRIPFLPKPDPKTPKFSVGEFFTDVRRAMTNVNYVWLLIGYFFLSMMIGLRGGLHLYTSIYFWDLSSEELRWFIIGSFTGFATAFLFAARMHGRFDKKQTILWSLVGFAAIPAVPVVLGLAGVMSHETPGLVWILIGFSALSSAAMSILQISVMSALADIADENELKHGVRQEGILYSTRSLAAKLDQAIGTLLAGLVLKFIAFPVGAKGKADVAPDVLFNLVLWDGVIAAIPGLIALLAYARYRITQESHAATQAALRERRAEAARPPEAKAAAAAPAEAAPALAK
ncbi:MULTISPECIES: MFS transporter [Phenylobacterium]|uniref:Na+/melibiose symporter-like transporter n=1 Tax=Phenylobacterium koreense TaxID=266125 RepID=A0ABV2EJA9_9CAUL